MIEVPKFKKKKNDLSSLYSMKTMDCFDHNLNADSGSLFPFPPHIPLLPLTPMCHDSCLLNLFYALSCFSFDALDTFICAWRYFSCLCKTVYNLYFLRVWNFRPLLVICMCASSFMLCGIRYQEQRRHVDGDWSRKPGMSN